MPTFVYNDKIKFILPEGYEYDCYPGESGRMVNEIHCGEYLDDFGSTEYEFKCGVLTQTFNEVGPGVTPDNLLETALREKFPDYMILPGKPKTAVAAMSASLADVVGGPLGLLFGMDKMTYILSGFVQTGSYELVMFTIGKTVEDDEEKRELIRHLGTVLDAMRINGRKIPAAGSISEQFMRKLGLWDGPAREEFRLAFPGQELYPHYNSLRNAGGSFGGITVVVNANGTEYAFIPLKSLAESGDSSSDNAALFRRIVAKDTEAYDLDRKAKAMQPLFHVNESVFDPRHDRECELEEGLMHRAYMMSGLRSFAWTLADYCQEHNCTPDDVDSGVACRIANFVANKNWLNYDGDSYCQGLCSGSDLHVFFIPDSVTETDKKKLMPSQEDIDRVRQMKEKFPAYRDILSEVHSLNALRKDLKYIYPAVKQLWDRLKEERDYNEALLGNEADIVYAWCALALAAKEPFFSEDGPMSCYFSQIIDEKVLAERYRAAEEERSKAATAEWIEKYGNYIEKNPDIDFNGTLFVFSGLAGHWAEKDHPTVQKVIEKGGQYRSKVSGLTNYLVVNPGDAGSSKIVAVMEQRQKGKNVKVILLSDLEAALNGTKASKSAATTNATKKTSTKTATSSVPKGKKVPKKDCDIDDEKRLTGYIGSETRIILPQGIEIIGENAFMSSEIESVVVPEGVEKIEYSGFGGCKSLKSVTLPSSLRVIEGDAFRMCEELKSIVIPEGVTEIGMDAFTSCNKLKDIYLPDSLWDIGYNAFCTFSDGMTLHVPKGSDAETYAKDNDIKYDNKKAPEATTTASTNKPTATEKAAVPAKSTVRSTSTAGDFTIEKGVLTGYSGTATDIIIPAGITEIGSFVFFENENIVTLVIPEGVRKIGDCAFGYCPNLERVSLPESLEDLAGFNSCKKLSAIELPSNVKVIRENAFFCCKKLKRIVVPPSVTTIENGALDAGYLLKDVYIPASVQNIHEYTFLGSNNVKIHTSAGSYAEAFAKRRRMSWDNHVDDIWSDTEEDSFDVSDAVGNLNAQIAELDTQELSAEDRETLSHIKEQMNAIGEQLEQGQSQFGKYSDYLERQEPREKAAEAEKAQLKAEALAAGKSEKDVINMYVILTNEKKLGKLHRSADEFYEIYEEDFAALSKTEVIRTRKDILEEMEDETLCAYYVASFKQRTVKDRFVVSTRNLNNVSTEPELAIKAKWAIDNSKEWYLDSEFAEVRRLMDADLETTRADLDSKLGPINSAWKKYATAKEFLQVVISEKSADGSDLKNDFSNFQIVIGAQLVQVQIASKGFLRLSTTVMNCFTWYWGVTVREIWEAAMKNDLYDTREGACNGSQLANQAMNQIRAKYPTTTAASNPVAPPASVKPVITSNIPAQQPAKKEGCYIATALYGSYDAPQVMVLRRFRDEVLSCTALGRWFIRTYYRFSPPIAEHLKDAKWINRLVRSILDKLVSKLNSKQHH